MARKRTPHPTDGELEILRVLWERGPSTVRQVHKELNRRKRTGYTTVLKIMQIMTGKKLVKRDTSERPQIYEAHRPKEQVERQLVLHLLDRMFGGSSQKLVLSALTAKAASAEDLAEIKRIIRKLERESDGND